MKDAEILKNLVSESGGTKELAADLGITRQTLWDWGNKGLTARGRVLINNQAKKLRFWLPPDFMERDCR